MASCATAPTGAYFMPLEQLFEQGAVTDLLAGLVTPEAAASSAPLAGGGVLGELGIDNGELALQFMWLWLILVDLALVLTGAVRVGQSKGGRS